MLRNSFKIAVRTLERNKAYALISIMSLALGITCAILIFSLVKYHLSFDTFHSKKDRIYRITTEMHDEEGISPEANVPQPIGKALLDDYTFTEKVAMVFSRPELLVSIPSSDGNKKFKEILLLHSRNFFTYSISL